MIETGPDGENKAERPVRSAVLSVYIVFAALSTAWGMFGGLIAPPELREWLVPYVGWGGFLDYWPTLPALLISRVAPAPAGKEVPLTLFLLTSTSVVLLLGAAWNLFDFATTFHQENFGNPWLTVSPWRPVWIVLLPAAWAHFLWRERARIRLRGADDRGSAKTGAPEDGRISEA